MKFLCAVMLFLAVSVETKATEYVFCNSCFSKSDFENYAKGVHGNGFGFENYQVINDATGEIWNVYVERIYEPEVGLFLKVALGTPATAADIQAYVDVRDFVTKDERLVIVPPGTFPTDGYVSHTSGTAAFISSQPWFPTLTQRPLATALSLVLGTNPVIVVVFPNGDVAKFEVVNMTGGTACCVYVPGSARDVDGNVIVDAPSGGSVGSPPPAGDYTNPAPGALIALQILVNGIKFECKPIPTGVECRRLYG